MRAVSFLFILARLGAQALEVTPSRVLIDEPARIHATGCQPNEHLTIHAELIDGASGRWGSQSEFVADPQGNIDTSTQAPIGGSYKEVSAMGPVWPMKPRGFKGRSVSASSQFRRPDNRVSPDARQHGRFNGES